MQTKNDRQGSWQSCTTYQQRSLLDTFLLVLAWLLSSSQLSLGFFKLLELLNTFALGMVLAFRKKKLVVIETLFHLWTFSAAVGLFSNILKAFFGNYRPFSYHVHRFSDIFWLFQTNFSDFWSNLDNLHRFSDIIRHFSVIIGHFQTFKSDFWPFSYIFQRFLDLFSHFPAFSDIIQPFSGIFSDFFGHFQTFLGDFWTFSGIFRHFSSIFGYFSMIFVHFAAEYLIWIEIDARIVNWW